MATGAKETGQIEAEATGSSDRLERRGLGVTVDFDPEQLPCLIPRFWYELLALRRAP